MHLRAVRRTRRAVFCGQMTTPFTLLTRRNRITLVRAAFAILRAKALEARSGEILTQARLLLARKRSPYTSLISVAHLN